MHLALIPLFSKEVCWQVLLQTLSIIILKSFFFYLSLKFHNQIDVSTRIDYDLPYDFETSAHA